RPLKRSSSVGTPVARKRAVVELARSHAATAIRQEISYKIAGERTAIECSKDSSTPAVVGRVAADYTVRNHPAGGPRPASASFDKEIARGVCGPAGQREAVKHRIGADVHAANCSVPIGRPRQLIT